MYAHVSKLLNRQLALYFHILYQNNLDISRHAEANFQPNVTSDYSATHLPCAKMKSNLLIFSNKIYIFTFLCDCVMWPNHGTMSCQNWITQMTQTWYTKMWYWFYINLIWGSSHFYMMPCTIKMLLKSYNVVE